VSRTFPVSLAVTALLGLSCATIPRAHGPLPAGLRQEEYDALQFFASRKMRCGASDLVYERFGEGRHLFTGCNDTLEMLLIEGSDAEAYGAVRGFIIPAPSNTFSHRYSCDVRKVTDRRVDVRTRILEGCGQRSTYVAVCAPRCVWLESAEASAGAASSP
jgi:hypothetical protein